MDNDKPMSECPLEVTSEEFAKISRCEAVVLREYERPDGSRFAKVVGWGDIDEMNLQADSVFVIMVPTIIKYIAQQVIPVSELLEPTKAAKDGN